MLPTVEMRFRPLKNIHARCIPDAFSRQREPCEPTTGCWTNGVFGQNVCQRLGELAIKRRNVRAATHDLLKGRDPPALTVIFLSALRASELFGKQARPS